MKKLIILLILILPLVLATHSQNVYSRQYMEGASAQELRANFAKARKLKKRGMILTLGGVGASLTGIYTFAQAWEGNLGEVFSTIGPVLFFGGSIATLIGIPSMIIGSIRVKKINNVIAAARPYIKLDLKPYAQYNLVANKYCPSISLLVTL